MPVLLSPRIYEDCTCCPVAHQHALRFLKTKAHFSTLDHVLSATFQSSPLFHVVGFTCGRDGMAWSGMHLTD